MTARVLRPAIVISTVVAILVAALAVYALSVTGDARADSVYKPTLKVWMCNKLPAGFSSTDPALAGDATCGEGGPAENKTAAAATDYTVVLDYPSGNLNFSNVVTLSPNGPTTVAAGTKVGGLRSLTNLGLINGNCSTALVVDFVFYNVALPNGATRATMTNIAWPKGYGVPTRFGHWKVGDGVHTSNPPVAGDPDWATVSDTPVTTSNGANGDGTTLGFQNYPIHLLDIFDPDFVGGVSDGPTEPLIPTAVYGGLTLVSGDWIPLYFAVFPAGGLSAMPHPLGGITATMGSPSVSILTDPSATIPSPSSISDFCTSLNVTTMLRSNIHSNPAAGTGLFVQYNASLRDTDQDGYENSIDTCPLATPSVAGQENPRNVTAGTGDSDGDGIMNSCDTNAPDAADADVDNDGYQNRQDLCPQVADSNAEAELGNTAANPDRGPRTDGMGDTCDTGSITVTQNGRPVTITLANNIGNGRYLISTNIAAKCFSGTDADNDGYCTAGGPATDNADAGTCATTTPNSCAVRQNSFIVGTCAASPACQMDSDGDTVAPTSGVISHWSDAIETYLGTDATKPCSQDATADNEGPTNTIGGLDAWPLDVNDSRGVTGADWLRVAGAINQAAAGGAGRAVNRNDATANGTPTQAATITAVPFMGFQPLYQTRFDLNWDGLLVLGSDLGKFSAYMGKSCGTAGAPPLNSNGSASFQQ